MGRFSRCACAFVAGLASAPGVAAWACEAAPAFDPEASAEARRDQAGRAVAPIFINGEGPFRFIIDTGANRSVLAASLADRLGLPRRGIGRVHSIEGVREAPLVGVETLSFGPTTLSSGDTPVIDGPMLAGEHGLLGVDGMAGRMLYIDFDQRCVEIFDKAPLDGPAGWSTIAGRFRFGSLIVAEGLIQGVRVNVLIDTGASISLANTAFRSALGRVRADYVEYHGDRAFTAGRPVFLDDAVWAPRVRFGDVPISNVMAYVGDYHIFDLWGFTGTPTLLIGMDVLAQSQAMAIDYERGLVHFRDEPRGRW